MLGQSETGQERSPGRQSHQHCLQDAGVGWESRDRGSLCGDLEELQPLLQGLGSVGRGRADPEFAQAEGRAGAGPSSEAAATFPCSHPGRERSLLGSFCKVSNFWEPSTKGTVCTPRAP